MRKLLGVLLRSALAVLLCTSAISAAADEHTINLRVLKAALADPDPVLRSNAAAALSKIGDKAAPAVPELIVAARDPDPVVRANAASALGNTKTESRAAIGALISLLGDSSHDTRSSAIGALGELGPAAHGAVPALIEILKTREWNLQYSAAEALGKMKLHAVAAVPVLLAIIKTDQSDLKEAAIKTTAGLIRAVEHNLALDIAKVLIAASEQPSRSARVAAIKALESSRVIRGNETLMTSTRAALLRNIKDPDEEVRLAAWETLGALDLASGVEQEAIVASRDADYRIRRAMISRAADIDTLESAEIIYRGLRDPASVVRASSYEWTSGLTAGKATVCREVMRLGIDRDEDVRAVALTAVADCDIQGDLLDQRVATAMTDSNPDVRIAGLTVKRKTPATIRAVLDGLQDTEQAVRTAAIGRVLAQSPMGPEAIPRLETLVTDTDPTVAIAAAQALATFGTQATSAMPALGSVATGKGSARETALQAYGFVAARDSSAIKALLPQIKAGNAPVAVVEALGRQAVLDSGTINVVVEAMAATPSEEAWEAGVWALASRGEPALRAIQTALDATPPTMKESGAPKRRGIEDIFTTPDRDRRSQLERLLAEVEEAQGTEKLVAASIAEGKSEAIVAGPRHAIVAMATWCRHSEAFAKFLEAEITQRMTEGWIFSFVFSDESDVVDEAVAGGKDKPQRQLARSAMKDRLAGATLYDPDFLAKLPGKAYVMDRRAFHKAFGFAASAQFPTVFVPAAGRFEMGSEDWAKKGARLPAWYLKTVKW